MLITPEILKKHKACQSGIKYIERFYPDGAEMIQIIKDKHIPKEMLHWGRQHLTNSQEELKAYCEACNIENSDGFWYSVDVFNSQYVVKSKDVKNSRCIYESTDISNSQDVVHCETVENSKQIFYSLMIEDSEKIYRSDNITESENICGSKTIFKSKNVIGATNVFDSSEIIRGFNITNSHFCQDCSNIKNCMFCTELIDAEYCIFNNPVSKEQYELFERQYKKYFNSILTFIDKWPEGLTRSIEISPTRKFDDWFGNISPTFWRWVKTLPNFDAIALYNITFLPENLMF